jgi:hypothetical protein
MDGPTLASFSREVRERVRADMQSIRNPDGDVQPAAFYYFPGGAIRRVKLPWSAFAPDRRGHLALAIAQATRMTKPLMLALQMTAYFADANLADLDDEQQAAFARREYPEGWTMPSQREDRREVVWFFALDRSDAEAWMADITRDGRNPPAFGDWRPPIDAATPGEMGRTMVGKMIEPIRKAMWGSP